MSDSPSQSSPPAETSQRNPTKILLLTCGIGFALMVIAVTLAAVGSLLWVSSSEELPYRISNDSRSPRPTRAIEEFTPVTPATEPVDIFDDLESSSER